GDELLRGQIVRPPEARSQLLQPPGHCHLFGPPAPLPPTLRRGRKAGSDTGRVSSVVARPGLVARGGGLGVRRRLTLAVGQALRRPRDRLAALHLLLDDVLGTREPPLDPVTDSGHAGDPITERRRMRCGTTHAATSSSMSAAAAPSASATSTRPA